MQLEFCAMNYAPALKLHLRAFGVTIKWHGLEWKENENTKGIIHANTKHMISFDLDLVDQFYKDEKNLIQPFMGF